MVIQVQSDLKGVPSYDDVLILNDDNHDHHFGGTKHDPSGMLVPSIKAKHFVSTIVANEQKASSQLIEQNQQLAEQNKKLAEQNQLILEGMAKLGLIIDGNGNFSLAKPAQETIVSAQSAQSVENKDLSGKSKKTSAIKTLDNKELPIGSTVQDPIV